MPSLTGSTVIRLCEEDCKARSESSKVKDAHQLGCLGLTEPLAKGISLQGLSGYDAVWMISFASLFW
jgi:hypothetical protein